MLRGSCRHDGIPNKQSVKDTADRDRDRQREQQRKERAQMLPVDKEIHAGSQDLFSGPVKVKPSIEDNTSIQIRNSLGNFDQLRRLIDPHHPPNPGPGPPSSSHTTNDRGSEYVALTSHRNQTQNQNQFEQHPPPYRGQHQHHPPQPPNPVPDLKNQNLYQRNLNPFSNHYPPPSSTLTSSSFGPGNSSLHSSTSIPASTSTSSLYSSSTSTSNTGLNQSPCFRLTTTPSNQSLLTVPKVPTQLPHTTISFNTNPNQPHYQQQQQQLAATTTTLNIGPILNPISNPNPNPNIFNNSVNQINKNKPNLQNPYNNHYNSGIGGTEGISISISNSNSVLSDIKVESGGIPSASVGGLSIDHFSTVLNNESNSVRDAKINFNVSTSTQCKKPPLERGDSIDLETIIKEMTDVVPPLTAIQTPVKEIKESRKILPPRRLSSHIDEKIVQSVIEDTKLPPPPVSKMESSDSSSSYESDSDSESDSGSNSSHTEDNDKSDNLGCSVAPTTGSPTTKWDLSSFLKKENLVDHSRPDVKPTSFGSFFSDHVGGGGDTLQSGTHDKVDNVSSTITAKPLTPSPLEKPDTKPGAVANTDTRTKAPTRPTKGASNSSRLEPNIPKKATKPSTIPNKSKGLPIPPYKPPKIRSLSASSSSSSSSEDEPPPPPPKPKPKRKPSLTSKLSPPLLEKKSSSSSAGASAPKRPRTSGGQSSSKSSHKSDLESPPDKGKGSKNGQDKNKTDTLKKLFSSKPSTKVQSPSLEEPPKPAHPLPMGKPSPNRVSGKGKPSTAHNGELQSSSSKKKESSSSSSSKDKEKEKQKDKSSSDSPAKKHKKPSSGNMSTKPPAHTETAAAMGTAKMKEDMLKAGLSHSSLIVRIPLEKLRRKPPIGFSFPTIPTATVTPFVKGEASGKRTKSSTAASGDSHRSSSKGSQNSSRVGSSSDPSLMQQFPHHDPGVSRDRDNQLCSDPERLSPHAKKRPKKRSKASPKKTTPKRDMQSHAKSDLNLSDDEVTSANVVGYATPDSFTKTPPVDPDVIQAPDSSLNPSHLQSPFVQQQVQYFSYFERQEIKDDLLSKEQEYYLEQAKKLKHNADKEATSTAQASMYLEAGLFFILTGLNMEEHGHGSHHASYTMYRDTLQFLQYIPNRFNHARVRSLLPNEIHQEAKIVGLSMRCQSLLFFKLFKMKMRETKDLMGSMHDFFGKPGREPVVVNSPLLSTPSPHSPTSSPAGSSSVLAQATPPHPAPMFAVPRPLYTQIQKNAINAYNCVMAHDTWELADAFVAKHNLEEFFISIERHLGPLTIHSTLCDLVRYSRYGLQLVNGS